MGGEPEDFEFLKGIYQKLEDQPLEPGDPMYQPIYDHLGPEDPVVLMRKHIRYSAEESVQLFSGFRGSGKTTELNRLRTRLEEDGALVLYADFLRYLNPSEPVEITDLLLVLAGAFSDALEERLGQGIIRESYWTRVVHYLGKTEINLPEFGIKAGIDLKLTLKTTPSFRSRVQENLRNQIGELVAHTRAFFEEGVKAIRNTHGQGITVVFIFDSMEQIRGSISTEAQVMGSVERLFSEHFQSLKVPYIHMVYTVPPWLRFVKSGAKPEFITTLPSIRLWNRGDRGRQYPRGWDALRSVIQRRLGDDGCQRFWGNPDPKDRYPLAEKLIAACGGHLRDLLALLQATVLRAQKLPASSADVDGAIRAIRGNFLPISIEDAHWLAMIGELHTTALPTTDPVVVHRLTRFLDTHLVLFLRNGEDWYDLHPLIRDEVAQIVAQHPQAGSI